MPSSGAIRRSRWRHCASAGIRIPTDNGFWLDAGRSWVERCDECQLYESDEEAAEAVGLLVGKPVLCIPDKPGSPYYRVAIEIAPDDAEQLDVSDYYDCWCGAVHRIDQPICAAPRS